MSTSKASSQDSRNTNNSSGSQQHRRGGGNPSSRSARGNRQQKQPQNENPEWIALIANLVGSIIQVTVKDGTVYSGVFHTANTQDNLGVCLKMAQKINEDGRPDGQLIKMLAIMGKDVIAITAANVDLMTVKENQGFKTDTAISNSGDIRERVLEKWEPSQEETSLESLNDEAQHVGGNWDQFAVNEKLFGVTTDFEENIYTTVLDKSAPDFKRKEAEAIKIANEIQRSATSNTHLAEERGHATGSTGQDEDDRYSSVLRNAPTKHSAPPQVRKSASSRGPMQQSQNNGRAQEKTRSTPSPPVPQKSNSSSSILKPDPSKDSGSWADGVSETPPVKNAWSRERPFKANAPAIPSNVKKAYVEKASSGVDRSSPQRNQQGSAAQSASSIHNISNSSNKPLEYAQVANRRTEKMPDNHHHNQQQHSHQQQQQQHPASPAQEKSTSGSSHKPVKAFNGILDRDTQKQQHGHESKPITVASDQPAEPVAKAFSKFVHKEKEQRKMERKKEIGTVINELKSFSATFKLTTPVPSDLQELFAKNKNSSSSSSLDTVPTEKPAPVQTKSSVKSNATPVSPSSSSNFKFNAKAMEFRPNPNAAAFVPSIPAPFPEKNAFFGTLVIDKTPLSINEVYSAGFRAHTGQKPTTVLTQWPSNINVSFRQILPHHMPQGGMMGMPPPPVMPFEEMYGSNEGGYPPPMPYGYPVPPYGSPYGPPRPRGYPPQHGMPYGIPYGGPMMYPNRPPMQWPPMSGDMSSHDGSTG